MGVQELLMYKICIVCSFELTTDITYESFYVTCGQIHRYTYFSMELGHTHK